MVPSIQEPLWNGQTSSSNLPPHPKAGMTFEVVPEGPNGLVPCLSRGGGARSDSPHPRSDPKQGSRRREDPHRVGRDPGRGRGLGTVPARGDSPHDLLQMAEGLHGGWQGADVVTQTRQLLTLLVGCNHLSPRPSNSNGRANSAHSCRMLVVSTSSRWIASSLVIAPALTMLQ